MYVPPKERVIFGELLSMMPRGAKSSRIFYICSACSKKRLDGMGVI